jgi:GAF domain-containing protein
VLDGRLPGALADAREHAQAAQLPVTEALQVGAHVAAPIVTNDGRVFGTVCAYAHGPRQDVEKAWSVVNEVARALAKALDQAQQA